jgi:uncharacterized protein
MNTFSEPEKLSDTSQTFPNLGLGLGLRSVHFSYISEHLPKVDWFEIISENFMYSNGKPRHILRLIAEHYLIVMHGVSLSIGSTEGLNQDYLKSLKDLADEIKPAWISDHLCWTGINGTNTHDLLPLPLNESTLKHVAERIKIVQDYLNCPLIIENPSSYLSFNQSTIPEAEFLKLLVEKTGCGLLLDVNNVYVSCFNSGNNPFEYINFLPAKSIVQMHLAGHQNCGTHIIDTHDRTVSDDVWELFRLAWNLTGGVSTSLEWDGNIPPFEDYFAELHKAEQFMHDSELFEKTDTEQIIEHETFSTPIDFMINPLMKETIHTQ